MTALLATFVSIKTMADGSPRITLDLQCTLAEVAALGLIPGVAFGIARIHGSSTVGQAETVVDIGLPPDSTPKNTDLMASIKPGPLCIMACTFCADRQFWSWLEIIEYFGENAMDAKEFILAICHIASRKELDTNHYAAERFHREIRAPFMAWRDAQ